MKPLLIKVRNHFLPNPTVNTLSSSPSILWRGFEGVFGIDRIHRFQGGLSNQMFQYSYAFALQQRFPARVRVDLCGYANVHPEMQYRIEEVFTLPDRFPVVPNNFARAAKTLRRLSGRDWSFEHTVEYKEAYLGDDLRGFVQGYFSFVQIQRRSRVAHPTQLCIPANSACLRRPAFRYDGKSGFGRRARPTRRLPHAAVCRYFRWNLPAAFLSKRDGHDSCPLPFSPFLFLLGRSRMVSG